MCIKKFIFSSNMCAHVCKAKKKKTKDQEQVSNDSSKSQLSRQFNSTKQGIELTHNGANSLKGKGTFWNFLNSSQDYLAVWHKLLLMAQVNE